MRLDQTYFESFRQSELEDFYTELRQTEKKLTSDDPSRVYVKPR